MSRDFIENVENKLVPLEILLGMDNVEDIKKRISDMIVSSVSNDISHYQRSEYIFYPPDYIQSIAGEAFDEVEKKIKKMYKDAMLDVAERSVQRYKELIVSDLVKESGEHE